MKSLAREFGRSGTTANTVSLGLVETPHDKEWVDANREKLIKLYPLRRLGVPGDVAPMVTLAGLAAQRLDHRAGAEHQRRVQHGLREADDAAHRSDSAHSGIIAPARRRAWRQVRLSRRPHVGDLCRAA